MRNARRQHRIKSLRVIGFLVKNALETGANIRKQCVCNTCWVSCVDQSSIRAELYWNSEVWVSMIHQPKARLILTHSSALVCVCMHACICPRTRQAVSDLTRWPSLFANVTLWLPAQSSLSFSLHHFCGQPSWVTTYAKTQVFMFYYSPHWQEICTPIAKCGEILNCLCICEIHIVLEFVVKTAISPTASLWETISF